MKDRSLGFIIFALGFVGVIVYTFWLFWPATENDALFYCTWIGVRWALVIPLFIVVTGVFLVGMWIGYTMLATPPPMMYEDEVVAEESGEDT